MTLIYESELSTVHCGDARDITPQLDTESLDLIITDPPYGVAWQSGFRAEAFDHLLNDGAGDRDVVREVLRESVRLVGQKRHLYTFGPPDVCVSLQRHAGQVGRAALAARLRKGSVLRFPPPTGRKVRHPSEKPVPLLRELVESSSRQGEIVGDFFAGVGSTGVAAILSGRRTFLVELKREFADITVERIRRAEEIVKMAGAA